MGELPRVASVALLIAGLALVDAATSAWATVGTTMPGPGAGLLVGAAIVGTLVIAKLWRRK